MTNFLLSSSICLDSATIGFKSEKGEIFLILLSQDCCTYVLYLHMIHARNIILMWLQLTFTSSTPWLVYNQHHWLLAVERKQFYCKMFLKITAYIEIQSNVLTYASVDDKLTTVTVGQLWFCFGSLM